MSNTPKLADECKKLLDNGWQILLFKNELGSYTAHGVRPGRDLEQEEIDAAWDHGELPSDARSESYITDDFEPSQALYRLTEKVFGNIV